MRKIKVYLNLSDTGLRCNVMHKGSHIKTVGMFIGSIIDECKVIYIETNKKNMNLNETAYNLAFKTIREQINNAKRNNLSLNKLENSKFVKYKRKENIRGGDEPGYLVQMDNDVEVRITKTIFDNLKIKEIKYGAKREEQVSDYSRILL